MCCADIYDSHLRLIISTVQEENHFVVAGGEDGYQGVSVDVDADVSHLKLLKITKCWS